MKPPSKSTEKIGQNTRIPRDLRNLQTSYTDAEMLFQEYEESEEELRAFSGFALALETVEYPYEPLIYSMMPGINQMK